MQQPLFGPQGSAAPSAASPMRILVGWSEPTEAETIALLLNVDDKTADVIADANAFERAARDAGDVLVLALDFPSPDACFELFCRLREQRPEVPIIGVSRQGEIVHLARFISRGLHSYVTRDASTDFILLLTPLVEAAYASLLAERSRKLAERLREEIDSVRRLQESVIPHDLPTPANYRIAARYEPAQIRVLGTMPVVMAGGDYYNVFNLDDETLILLVGDAAGHGVKACMSIMTMHTLIRMIRDHRYIVTGQFVAEVNRRLCRSDVVQDEGGFITLMYCSLNLRTHVLEWTSAGHPMPMLHDLTTNEVRRLGGEDDAGLPLAVDEEAEFCSCRTELTPGSRLLLYTDGIVEAMAVDAAEHAQFGEEGLIRTLQNGRDLPLANVLDRLFNESHAFTAGQGRHDDTSVVLVERMLNGG